MATIALRQFATTSGRASGTTHESATFSGTPLNGALTVAIGACFNLTNSPETGQTAVDQNGSGTDDVDTYTEYASGSSPKLTFQVLTVINGVNNFDFAGFLLEIQNAVASSPINAHSSTTGTQTSGAGTLTTPSITPTVAGCLIVAWVAYPNATTNAVTASGSFAGSEKSVQSSLSTEPTRVVIASFVQATAAAITCTFTMAPGVSIASCTVGIMAIAPLSGAATNTLNAGSGSTAMVGSRSALTRPLKSVASVATGVRSAAVTAVRSCSSAGVATRQAVSAFVKSASSPLVGSASRQTAAARSASTSTLAFSTRVANAARLANSATSAAIVRIISASRSTVSSLTAAKIAVTNKVESASSTASTSRSSLIGKSGSASTVSHTVRTASVAVARSAATITNASRSALTSHTAQAVVTLQATSSRLIGAVRAAISSLIATASSVLSVQGSNAPPVILTIAIDRVVAFFSSITTQIGLSAAVTKSAATTSFVDESVSLEIPVDTAVSLTAVVRE